MPRFDKNSMPALTIWVNGPAGSGKTRLALQFPRVFAITFDPTGLDIVYEPENAQLRENLVWHASMNGLPLETVFTYTDKPSEDSLYGALALAKQLAAKGEIETVLIDGFTYLAQLKWTQICEAVGIDPSSKDVSKKGLPQQGMYDALGSFLDHLVLQNLMPMSGRNKVHVVITAHVQRESENTVKGVQDNKHPEVERASKRLVNLESDLSAQVLGSFRQRIDGLPSALIYLEHKLEIDEKATPPKEVIKYYAYCKMTRSQSLDTVIKAKNRFGLGTLNLTNASFFKTLLKKVEESRAQAQQSTVAPSAKATAATTTIAKGE